MLQGRQGPARDVGHRRAGPGVRRPQDGRLHRPVVLPARHPLPQVPARLHKGQICRSTSSDFEQNLHT